MKKIEINDLLYTNGRVVKEGDFALIRQEGLPKLHRDDKAYKNSHPEIPVYVQEIVRKPYQYGKITHCKLVSPRYGLFYDLNYDTFPEFIHFEHKMTDCEEFYNTWKQYPPHAHLAPRLGKFIKEYTQFMQDCADTEDLDAILWLAQYYYGYYHGVNDDENKKKQKEYLEYASQHGSGIASHILASKYRFGLKQTGLEMIGAEYYTENKIKNYQSYLEKAAKQGWHCAQYELACNYEKKNGFFDKMEAVKWFKRAADQGRHPEAMLNLAEKYELGIGTWRSYKKAMYYYLQASEKGIAKAFRKIGRMHRMGLGVPMDTELADWWANEADKHGC